MSYYGFSPIINDYSGISRAGEHLGQAAKAGIEAYQDSRDVQTLTNLHNETVSEYTKKLTDSGMSKDEADITVRRYLLPPMRSETGQQAARRIYEQIGKLEGFVNQHQNKAHQSTLSSSFNNGVEESRHVGNIGGAINNMSLDTPENDYSTMRRAERGNDGGMLQIPESPNTNPQGRAAEMGVNGLRLQTPETPYTDSQEQRPMHYEPVEEKFNRPHTSEEMAGIRNQMGVSSEVSNWADEQYINPRRNLESLEAIGDEKEQFAALGKALAATGGVLTPEIKEMVKTLPNANTVANNNRYIYLGDARNDSAERIAAGRDGAMTERARIGANAKIAGENIKAAAKSDARGAAADDRALNSLRTNIRQVAEKIAKCGGKVEEIYGNGGRVAIRDLNKIVLAENPGAMQSLNTELRALYNTLNIYLAELHSYDLTDAQKKSIDELDRQVKEIIGRSSSAPTPLPSTEKPNAGAMVKGMRAVGNFFSGDSSKNDEPKQTNSGSMF
jgi:hypothetical protein